MDSVLLPLTRSPLLPQYITELQELMADEAIARERFINWLDEDKKAEFINGEIIVHSPAKLEHTDVQKLFVTLLHTYVARHGLGLVLYEKAMVRLTRNDYEPDICFWNTATASAFQRDQMLFPPPDLVVEILSPSTEDKDRGIKFTDYAAGGVSEYWLVDPVGKTIEQYDRVGNAFRQRATLVGNDRLTSKVIGGFDVELPAAFETAANLVELKRLLS